MRTQLIFITSIFVLLLLLSGCEQSPEDSRAYPIQFVKVREYPEEITNFQFIDWNHSGRTQVLTGYFGLNEEAPRVRVENLNGNLSEGRLARKGFLIRNRRFFASDTLRFRWIDTYIDVNNDGKYEGFLQKSTPTTESLIEFNPDIVGMDESNPGTLNTLFSITRPDTLPSEAMWFVTFDGPYPLPVLKNSPVAWFYLDFGASGIPNETIFLNSIDPWKESFRISAGTGAKYQCTIHNGTNEVFYILACDANGMDQTHSGYQCNTSYAIEIDNQGNVIWSSEIGEGQDKISCVAVEQPTSKLYVTEELLQTGDSVHTRLLELNPLNGAIVQSKSIIGHLKIPRPVDNDTNYFALLINETIGSVEWINRHFEQTGIKAEIPGIKDFRNIVTNFDFSIPTLYQLKTTRDDGSVFVSKNLKPLAYTNYNILTGLNEFDFPISDKPIPKCMGILRGEKKEFFKALEQNKYILVYADPNQYWLLWRTRWYIAIGGGLLILYLGILFSVKFIRNRREYQLAEFQIRELSRELLSTEERERRRIGRDLHDGVAQELSAIKLNIESIREAKSDPPIARSELNKVLTQLHGAITEIRNISHKLLPAGLDTLGLVVSVKSLLDDFRTDSNVTIEFTSSGFDHYISDADLSITIYRLIQEALNNIQRHARATLVKVSMVHETGSIKLTIEDNGYGFDVLQRRKEAVAQKRLGLFGMAERVDMYKGTFEIDSRFGLGTAIRIKLPVKENRT